MKFSRVKNVDKALLFMKIYEGIFGRCTEEEKTQVIQCFFFLNKRIKDNIVSFAKKQHN